MLYVVSSGKPAFLPAAKAAIHRDHVGVAHVLQVLGRQGRAEAAAAIEDDRGVRVGDRLFDIPLDDSLAQMDRAGEMARLPLAVFADVDQVKRLTAVEPAFHVLRRCIP